MKDAMTASEYRSMKGKKPSKYKNKKCEMLGFNFDSKKEAHRYLELHTMKMAGQITDLRLQVKFELLPAQYENGKCIEKSCHYVADFTYQTPEGLEVEDVKSEATRKLPLYILKRKLMLFIQGIKIKEV